MRYLLCVLMFVACVLPQPAPVGQPGAGDQPQQATAPVGLTCVQIVECLAGCNQDAACFQDCVARGDDSSRAAVGAVIDCSESGENAQCEAEMSSCRDQGQIAAQQPQQPAQQAEQQPEQQAQLQPQAASEQMLPGQPHTTANILPWMTGNWEGNNYHYTFYDDGRVRRASGVPLYTEKTGRYACASIVNETGTVTQEGDLLIMQFAAAEENHCGDKSSAPALTVRYRIVWYQYNGPVELKLVDIDCTRGAMYCNDPMTRR